MSPAGDYDANIIIILSQPWHDDCVTKYTNVEYNRDENAVKCKSNIYFVKPFYIFSFA